MDDKQITAKISWLKQHERIVISFMLLFVFLWLGNKYIDYRANVDSKAVAVADAQYQQVKQANDSLAKQVQDQETYYKSLVDSLTQQNKSLLVSIQNRNNTLKQQQQRDVNMADPELIVHWSSLVPNTQASEYQAGNGTINVTENAARQTVVQLDSIPVLEADSKEEKQVIDNQQKEINAGTKTVNDLNTQVVGLNKQISADDNRCTAEKNDIKAQAAKSKRKWFIVGTVLGAVARGFIK